MREGQTLFHRGKLLKKTPRLPLACNLTRTEEQSSGYYAKETLDFVTHAQIQKQKRTKKYNQYFGEEKKF